MITRDQLDFHIGDGDRLVAVVGHHEKNGQESVRRKIHRKNLGLFWRVVGVGGDGPRQQSLDCANGYNFLAAAACEGNDCPGCSVIPGQNARVRVPVHGRRRVRACAPALKTPALL